MDFYYRHRTGYVTPSYNLRVSANIRRNRFCSFSWSAVWLELECKDWLRDIFSKMKYFDAYLSPEIFPRFAVSSFLATSQRGIVFESEEKNIFISCPWRLVELIKSIKALWVLGLPHAQENNTNTLCKQEFEWFFPVCQNEGRFTVESEGQSSAGLENKEFRWENHSKSDWAATMSSGSKLTIDFDKWLWLSAPRLIQMLLYSRIFLKRNCCTLSCRVLGLHCVLLNWDILLWLINKWIVVPYGRSENIHLKSHGFDCTKS